MNDIVESPVDIAKAHEITALTRSAGRTDQLVRCVIIWQQWIRLHLSQEFLKKLSKCGPGWVSGKNFLVEKSSGNCRNRSIRQWSGVEPCLRSSTIWRLFISRSQRITGARRVARPASISSQAVEGSGTLVVTLAQSLAK